jgi:hypothetical protein
MELIKLKLGTKVEFATKYVRNKDSVMYDHYTEEQQKQMDEKAEIILTRFKRQELSKPLTGIVCGVRNVVIETTLSEDVDKECMYSYNSVGKKVFLVATNLTGFHKVAEEDIKIIEEAIV